MYSILAASDAWLCYTGSVQITTFEDIIFTEKKKPKMNKIVQVILNKQIDVAALKEEIESEEW